MTTYMGAGSLASVAVACSELAIEGLKGHRSLNREEIEEIKASLRKIALEQKTEIHQLAVALMAKTIGPYVQKEMAHFGAITDDPREGKAPDA